MHNRIKKQETHFYPSPQTHKRFFSIPLWHLCFFLTQHILPFFQNKRPAKCYVNDKCHLWMTKIKFNRSWSNNRFWINWSFLLFLPLFFCLNTECVTEADLTTKANVLNATQPNRIYVQPEDLPLMWAIIGYVAVAIGKMVLSLISIWVNKLYWSARTVWISHRLWSRQFIYRARLMWFINRWLKWK